MENLDETLVLHVATHDTPYESAEKSAPKKAQAAALARNPHKSRLVGTDGQPFPSYLELVKYYKRGTEELRAAFKEDLMENYWNQPDAFTSGWKKNNDFDTTLCPAAPKQRRSGRLIMTRLVPLK